MRPRKHCGESDRILTIAAAVKLHPATVHSSNKVICDIRSTFLTITLIFLALIYKVNLQWAKLWTIISDNHGTARTVAASCDTIVLQIDLLRCEEVANLSLEGS